MRTITLKEFVLEEFNRLLEAEGRAVRIVTEPAKPRLAADGGRVLNFRGPSDDQPNDPP